MEQHANRPKLRDEASRLKAWLPSAGALVAIALVSAAVAQTVEGVDIGAIRQNAKEQQQEAEALVAGVLDRGKPHEAEAEQARSDAMKALANISPADLPSGPSGAVDFDALIAGAASNAGDMEGSGPLFIVFASLSMPKASLAQLVADTSRAGGIVAFSGFPQNSAKAFAAGMKAVVTSPEQQAHIAIDPRLFRAFSIKAAPTFVTVSTDFELCDGFKCQTVVPPHDRMTGNVTVEYALDSFAGGRGPGAAMAATALARLRKRD